MAVVPILLYLSSSYIYIYIYRTYRFLYRIYRPWEPMFFDFQNSPYNFNFKFSPRFVQVKVQVLRR
jgi:hypothetical protein